MNSVFGVKVDDKTLHEVLKIAEDIIRERRNEYFAFVNLAQITFCNDDPKLMDFYNHSRLSLVEGTTSYRIAKLYHVPVREIIPGTDFILHACKLAVENEFKVFFLGGEPEKENIIWDYFRKQYENLNIAGIYAPPYGFERDDSEMEKIIRLLHESRADILFVCLGSPKQERLIAKYRNIYDIPLSLPVGSGIDILTGRYKRAPQWMTHCGLEWLFRSFQEPKRLFKRYMKVLFKMIKLMIRR